MSNVKGIGLTEEDFKRLLMCVSAAAHAFKEQGDHEEAFNFLLLGMKLTHFVDIEVGNASSRSDDPAFAEFLRSMGGGGEGN